MNDNWQIHLTRALIGIVVFLNLQCAVAFLAFPAAYSPAFELSGIPGVSMVRGMGILFVMWSIPSLFALSNPVKHRMSLVEALLMQGIGLAGESLLLLTLPAGHLVLRESAVRFIAFDSGGLILLIAAILLSAKHNHNSHGAA